MFKKIQVIGIVGGETRCFGKFKTLKDAKIWVDSNWSRFHEIDNFIYKGVK